MIAVNGSARGQTMPSNLYKTTIVVWTDFDPTDISAIELVDDVGDNQYGRNYIAFRNSRMMNHPEQDPHWDGTEYFDA